MLLLIALVLGFVEGATEFLPVSSTGHLIIAGHLLGFTGAKADTFEIVIQLGAILAVLCVYFQRFVGLLSFRREQGLAGLNGIKLLLITMLPAMIVGALFDNIIKQYLFNPITVAISLIVGGAIIIWFERRPKVTPIASVNDIKPRQALTIGLLQVLSLMPGVSRSATTILGGMYAGLNRETSVQYSFVVAVPIMIAATGYDLLKSRDLLQAGDAGLFITGFVAAFGFALLAIKLLLRFVKNNDFQPFGVYRIVLGVIVLLIFVR